MAAEPTRQLAGAAAIVMGAYVSSRLSGLLRDVAVSYRFGTGRELDAYLAANRVPDLVFQIVAGAAVASAFIPVYATYRARHATEEGWALVSALFTLAVVVLVPLIALMMLAAPWLMRLMAPGFPPEYQALAADLARIVLPAPLFFTLGCFATSLLNAHRRFFLAALAPTCYNLGIILGAVEVSQWLGIAGLAVGALLGSILFLLVQIPGLGQIGFRFRPRLALKDPGVRAIARLMGPRTLGLAVTQVNFVVTLSLASGIAGGVAALNYAWLLTMLPLGVFAMAISTAVFPALAEQGAAANHDELRHTLVDALRFILYLTIPAAIGLITLSSFVVQILYQRGQFTAESTAMTASALRFYALGLVGMASVEIVTRAFYALHDTLTPVKVAALGMTVNLGLAVALVRIVGLDGLALATAVASAVEATVLFEVARRRLPGLAARDLAPSAGRSLAAAAVMGGVVLALGSTTVAVAGSLGVVVQVGVAVLAGVGIYLATTTALGSPEVRRLRRLLLR